MLVLLTAIAVAFEPVIHTHPLTQSANAPCAVCVSAVARVTPLAAVTISPLVLVAKLAPIAVSAVITRTALPLASRAPPAA